MINICKCGNDTLYGGIGADDLDGGTGKEGDRIDLWAIDTKAFTGKAGELRYEKRASDTYIYADVNGDKKADFAIHLDDAVTLTKGYFVL